MSVMRWLVFVLMLMLLPLRGWTGDAMATRMALQEAQQAQHLSQTRQAREAEGHFSPELSGHAAPHPARHTPPQPDNSNPESHAAAMPADHADHASMAGQAGPTDCNDAAHALQHHGADGSCESCTACQTCHSVALTLAEPELQPRLLTRSSPPTLATAFASADPAGGSKPPIS